MKKKRFIKLLMGAGFSRNTATYSARAAAITHKPKEETLRDILAWRDIFANIPHCAPHVEPMMGNLARAIVNNRYRPLYGVDESNGTDYTAKVKGRAVKDGYGCEIYLIDEIHYEPPTKKNEGVLAEFTVTLGGTDHE